jgi:23S rRNA pseudouridine1911/1915/1917 synthase
LSTRARRLDLALIAARPEISRRRARQVIESGQVLVDGTPVLEAGRAVPEGARVEWDPHRRRLPRFRPDLPVLVHDPHLVVVDKPAGLLSVPTAPGRADEDTALGRLKQWARQVRGRPRVGVVHRLDRGTSGALCFALSEPVRQALRSLFRAHRIERRYAVLVTGIPSEPEGVIDLPLRDEWRRGRRGVARPEEASRPALTRWRLRESFAGAAWLEIELETGRQHQIRVHLAAKGLPVLGDRVYGAAQGPAGPGVAAARPLLHAWSLGFAHPLTGAPVAARAPLPPDFEAALRRLRHTVRGNRRRTRS